MQSFMHFEIDSWVAIGQIPIQKKTFHGTTAPIKKMHLFIEMLESASHSNWRPFEVKRITALFKFMKYTYQPLENFAKSRQVVSKPSAANQCTVKCMMLLCLLQTTVGPANEGTQCQPQK